MYSTTYIGTSRRVNIYTHITSTCTLEYIDVLTQLSHALSIQHGVLNYVHKNRSQLFYVGKSSPSQLILPNLLTGPILYIVQGLFQVLKRSFTCSDMCKYHIGILYVPTTTVIIPFYLILIGLSILCMQCAILVG